jgi:hypothetical protein
MFCSTCKEHFDFGRFHKTFLEMKKRAIDKLKNPLQSEEIIRLLETNFKEYEKASLRLKMAKRLISAHGMISMCSSTMSTHERPLKESGCGSEEP